MRQVLTKGEEEEKQMCYIQFTIINFTQQVFQVCSTGPVLPNFYPSAWSNEECFHRSQKECLPIASKLPQIGKVFQEIEIFHIIKSF